MDIIGHRSFFFIVSGTLVLAAILVLLFLGLRFGIDFLGGTLWQVRVGDDQNQSSLKPENVRNFLEQGLGMKEAVVYSGAGNGSFLIRLPSMSEIEHQTYLKALRTRFGSAEELRFDTIGPSIGKELRQTALWAIILVLFGISLYVTFAFRKVSYPIKSWKYGVITLITLFHDVIIPIGLFSVLGHFMGIEVDINFVVAALVVMGFSVHDTIVVFDRIRENLLFSRQGMNFENLAQVINTSINQTMARSINTSLTLIMVLLVLFFFGPVSLKYFVLTILVGVTVGTYSSIFVASPALLLVSRARN